MGKIVACVPAYNEEKTIAQVLVRTLPHVDELVVVDDGSDDNTGLIAEDLGALVIRHERNLGKGVALRRCLDWAMRNGSDIIVTLDADGQHNPDEIPTLAHVIQAGDADIAIGSRTKEREAAMSMDPLTLASNRVVSFLFSARYGGDFTDVQTGYRAFSRAAVERVLPHLRSARFEIELEIFCKARSLGLVLKEVPVGFRRRVGGRTKFTLFYRMRNLYFAFKHVLSFKPAL